MVIQFYGYAVTTIQCFKIFKLSYQNIINCATFLNVKVWQKGVERENKKGWVVVGFKANCPLVEPGPIGMCP